MKEFLTLNDIASINMGQSPESSAYNQVGNGLPFFQGNADFGRLHPHIRIFCSSPKKIAKQNDVLISVRAPIGAVNIAEQKCCIGRGLASITPKSNSCTNFIYYLLKSKAQFLQLQGTGSTFKAINKNILCSITVPNFSLMLQKQIAERLDKVQVLIALQKEQIKKLDDLIKSRFIDLFGDPVTNPKKWVQTPFHSLVKEMFIGPFGSDLKNENYVRSEQGYCVVYEQKHAIYHSVNLGFRYIDETKYKQLRRFLVKPGDFIMSCRGTIGKIYQLPPHAPCGIIHSSLMKISLDMGKINSEYFQWILASIIKNSTKDGGVIKMAITATNLGKKNVPIPPLSLQTKFTDFVAKIEEQKGLLTTRLTHLETLYKSLMQEYFG